MIFNIYCTVWMKTLKYLMSNWPAPANVTAGTTFRHSGLSMAPYKSNNLALHVKDNPAHVSANRQQLMDFFRFKKQPEWLEQTHGTHCVIVEESLLREADASITRTPGTILSILTADCLPVLLCNRQGSEVAAIHAGWKGLANGVIENTLNKMLSHKNELLAWIGPAICKSCYSVGQEVRDIFVKRYKFADPVFQLQQDKYFFNLALMAEFILNNWGIEAVYQSNACTFEQQDDFYSYRRSQQTGRMASLIWFN